MGGQLSKRPESSAPRVSEMVSCEAAFRFDSQLHISDTTLPQRMSRALSSLAAGEELRSISFDSLKKITACFLEMNQEVVKIILECKKDIWKTPELFELVEEYFDNSLRTLDFCTALERCLMRARDSQLIINVAIHRLEEELNYEKILEDLKLFKAAGDPFTEEFFTEFQAVYHQQRSMLEKLMTRKQKLDKKLKSVKAWRKVSCVIFVAAFASVLICSIVAAAVAAPPVAAALAAASSIPLGSMGKWFDALLKDYEVALKGEKEVLSSMQVGTYVTVEDLKSIRVLVDHLEIQISYLLHCVDFALKDEEAVRFGVEGIKKKLGAFMKGVEDLGEQADRCSRDIRRARTVVLQRIIRYPEE
ncbi:UPF0496 protein 1-like [Dendrobium catenatum]|uniref:UPF0496 protein 1 n=1 Tax=Dendrobium catenatum TaxID=906689 RepID=A0A2I0X5W7_9ASPA|nr:UPF0496 protein 1-like [Dendrobium catenatum]PKU83290.1 UPF0496 protein 1 [Dendrobium catenatum]